MFPSLPPEMFYMTMKKQLPLIDFSKYQLLDSETGADMLSHSYNLSPEGAGAGELFLVLRLRYRV